MKGFPLGGKLSAKRTDEGRNIYESFVSIIPASNTKERSVKPDGAAGGHTAVMKGFPFLLFLLGEKSAKKIVSLVPRLPLGGKAVRKAD